VNKAGIVNMQVPSCVAAGRARQIGCTSFGFDLTRVSTSVCAKADMLGDAGVAL
jgi:hypothetical protein